MQTGQIDQSWQEAERLIGGLGEPSLRQGLEAERAVLRGEAERRWRAIIDAAGARAAWPEALAEYRGFSLPALARVLVLRDAALEVALARSLAGRRAALWAFGVSLVAVLATLAVAGAALGLLLRRVVRPLRALTECVGRVAGGDLGLAVPGRGRADELGDMAAAVEALRAGAADRLALEAARAAEQEAQRTRSLAVDALLRGFEADSAGVLGAVAKATSQLDATAAGMAATARDGSARADAVAHAAAEASSNVESVASATEQLSASIAEVVRQVEAAAGAAREATGAAEVTGSTVRGLSEAASRIGDVVQLISDIAGQTNLLALNATIEAARAGEAGKGFAVVASEVKALAAQTARATDEIGTQISAMQAETGRTVEVVGTIGRIIGTVNATTALLAETAAQQAAATQEIGRAITEAAASTTESAQHASGMSEDAGRTDAAAGDVRAASAALFQQSEALRARVDGFLTSIRAA